MVSRVKLGDHGSLACSHWLTSFAAADHEPVRPLPALKLSRAFAAPWAEFASEDAVIQLFAIKPFSIPSASTQAGGGGAINPERDNDCLTEP